MNLLVLSLIHSCNYSCDECTMKEHMYPLGTHVKKHWVGSEEVDINSIKYDDLIRFLEKHISPKKWHIRITGGEPGLWPRINDLIMYLNDKEYNGVIETNGSLPLAKTDRFIRLGCWHKGYPKPRYCDVTFLLNRTDEDLQDKIRQIEGPYEVVPIRGPAKDKTCEDGCTVPPNIIHGYDELLCIYSQGQLQHCPGGHIHANLDWPEFEIFPMKLENCKTCPQAQMAWYLYKKYFNDVPDGTVHSFNLIDRKLSLTVYENGQFVITVYENLPPEFIRWFINQEAAPTMPSIISKLEEINMYKETPAFHWGLWPR